MNLDTSTFLFTLLGFAGAAVLAVALELARHAPVVSAWVA